MEEMLELGKAIKQKRLALNLRMDDVAKKADTTRTTLWAIENGTANCSIKTMLKIMAVLDLGITINNSN